MDSLKGFFETDFTTQREQWEQSLLAELKITDLAKKTSKKISTGHNWSTLSLGSSHDIHLSSSSWKKASNTFLRLKEAQIASVLSEELEGGVRIFFFHGECLTNNKWEKISEILKSHRDAQDIEVFILGGKKFSSSKIRVIDNLISGSSFQERGASPVQELGAMARNLIQVLKGSVPEDLYVGVYVDSLFFQSIAKIRAARLLSEKILQEASSTAKIKLVALTSYEGWTLFERYSNLLRNETAVAAAYIGGADIVQSAGYNSIAEFETDQDLDEHWERSLRLARNTTHILALESYLGMVQDAGFGSYHLESLTQHFCQESWKIMQRLLKGESLEEDISRVREEKLQDLKTRKMVMSGINDFPNAKEFLNLELKSPLFFRKARIFEELRLRMQKIVKPRVYIALFGHYGALNGRLNFVKNYFELLGLEVRDAGLSLTDLEGYKADLASRTEEIIVFCSRDEDYSLLLPHIGVNKSPHKFVAGKVEVSGARNLYHGQNVFDVLHEIVTTFERIRS